LIALLAPAERAAVGDGVSLAGRRDYPTVRQITKRFGCGMEPFAASVQPLQRGIGVRYRRHRCLVFLLEAKIELDRACRRSSDRP
jgi:hypothetical protein